MKIIVESVDTGTQDMTTTEKKYARIWPFGCVTRVFFLFPLVDWPLFLSLRSNSTTFVPRLLLSILI